MDIKYERLKEEDLEAILKIEQASFPVPWTRSMFEQELHIPTSHFFVAKALPGKEIVGYAGYWQVVDELHLINFAVHPEYRRQGLGKHLLFYILCDGKRLGLKKATLEVRASNQAAQRLYEQLGFKNIALRKSYYADNQEDAVIMWLYNLGAYS
ncbi:MAG: ribosomal protein S18-alanine N-acetyltransferase [bacterium]|nr:ribosomal protein S18-alanine N-acetyltransferase [bacterium]MDD5353772.1 ribosomal protein S18-alanine N-acetyltransferase [bacterium]MDD5756309.1 ribosomal protein S18-alanine N-acetyltransferase [bacterium]